MSEFLARLEELEAAVQDTTARWSSASKSGMGSDPDNPEWVAIVHNMVEARSTRERLFVNKAPEIIALVKAARGGVGASDHPDHIQHARYCVLSPQRAMDPRAIDPVGGRYEKCLCFLHEIRAALEALDK